jgi:hypothetical protein
MNVFSQRTISYLALSAAGLGVLLIAVRGYYAISFSEPLQLVTSGAEYESLFVIWKYINGLTVYADHTRIPFAGSFYNWVYYFFYGEVTVAALNFLSLGDAWLPTVTRLITATGAVYGAWIATRLFWEFSAAGDDFLNCVGLALALLIFLGPLMGFFGIATQPDIWGFAFDVTSVYAFLRLYQRRPLTGVLVFCLFAYLAWGFKQIFVFSTGTVGLFLLLRRDWKMLGVLVVLSWTGWGATLGLGSAQYVKTIVAFGGSTVSLDSANLIRNLSNFSVKFLPVLLGLAGVLAAIILSGRSKALIADVRSSLTAKGHRPHSALALIGAIITGVLIIPASAKLGASESYYFMLTFFLSLLLLSGLAWVRKPDVWPVTVSLPLGMGWLLHGLAICLVFAGVTGVLSKRHTHTAVSQVRDCLVEKKLSQPLFISDQYLSLPWMVPAEQHFVVQTNYRWDKPGGIEMEGGGIGGLIDKGYFATIVLGGNTYDGSDLKRYRKLKEKCGAFSIFNRISANDK